MTTIPTDETLIKRIQGLLAKAERTDNPHEAEAFSAKAAELMDKYRIDVARVQPKTEGILHHTFFLGGAKYLRASLALLGAVANHYGCVVTIPSTGNSKNPRLFGERVDIDATLMMFASLIIQRDRACLAEYVPYDANAAKFRNSFAYGYAYRINERLVAIRREQEQAAKSDHDMMALEVYDRRGKVELFLGNPSSVNHNRSRLNREGVSSGDAAAATADLGGGRMGKGTGPRAIGWR